MPAPSAAMIEPLAKAAMMSADLRGDNAGDLASALAECCGQGLQLWQQMAMMLPGTAAVVVPPAGTGSVVAPGMLLAPPAGGPAAGLLQGLAKAQMQAKGLRGEEFALAADGYGACLAQAISLAASSLMVAPGLVVAGNVTTTPGMLIGSVPPAASLSSIAELELRGAGMEGENTADLAGVMADFTHQALNLFMAMVMVAPGIACSPAATVAPGLLI